MFRKAGAGPLNDTMVSRLNNSSDPGRREPGALREQHCDVPGRDQQDMRDKLDNDRIRRPSTGTGPRRGRVRNASRTDADVIIIAGGTLTKMCSTGDDAAASEFRRMQIDTWGGTAFTHLIAIAIMISTAVTLNAAGITTITNAADAAEALRPLAGDFAFALFALGIIATGLLAVPVLAGSAAYALSEVMGWRTGLELKPRQAGHFYAVISLSVLAAVALDFLDVDPMVALFWTAVVNGVVAVPVMTVIMLLAERPRIMGSFTIRKAHKWLGWAATLIMALASVVMFATL